METVAPVIVVGVSESHSAAVALHWAAEEARARGARLLAVRAWEPRRRPAPYAAQDNAPTAAQQHAMASGGLQAALHREFGEYIPGEVAADLAQGSPERVLVARSAGAAMLVVGAISPALPLGRPIGPVVRACLSRAACPVVVVNTPVSPALAPAAPQPPARGGRTPVTVPAPRHPA